MEAVRAFNNELSSLYECKPPISRAKMAQVTKGAIKAIKFYKHVVQSVEKFIQKCKPEYKVPGLYVIDSVVRQSRHQFGAQKDVFAPRFTKNIITTFQNLFKCPGDERSKIVRVLNLWQKNEVFPSEIIQPLLDLAADPTKPALIAAAQAAVDGVLAASGKTSNSSQPANQQTAPHHHHRRASREAAGPKEGQEDSSLSQSAAESMLATQHDMLNTVTQLLQQTDSGHTSLSAQQQQLQQLQLLQQQLIQQTQLMQQPSGASIIDSNLLAQIQTLTNQLLAKTDAKPAETERFNKKLLDFDYGESDDEEGGRQQQHQGDTNVAGNVQTILNDTSLMQQIHQVSQTIQKNEQLQTELTEQEQRRRVLEQQQAEFDQQISQGMPPGAPQFMGHPPQSEAGYQEEGEYEEELLDEDFRDHQQMRDRDDRDSRRGDRRRRSRDRDRSRTPKRRRRTRSRSRDRRRSSRSRDRHRRSRSKDREREKQKEKERERKKKALPPLKDNCVSVCTTTIWIGHLNKFTQEEELKQELERYGPVENISMVPPRGCAYVVMSNRKDAFKAIDRLRGFKLNGSALKTAWAQSTGMREADYKEGWDVENGVKYIPWTNLPQDLSPLLDGAILDQDSMPDTLKDHPTEKSQVEEESGQAANTDATNMANMSMAESNQMPGQQALMGMASQPGVMPPGLPGMMPGMMMPLSRPLVPGMPPQAIAMNPGAPQMLPRGPQIPGMPGAGMSPMTIASTSASAVPQTIQNVAVSGAVPTSPAIAPRATGFSPAGGPPRFGFNPNLPPPSFRLPPPGFGLRHMVPGLTNSTPEDQAKTGNTPAKQPEMAWPPDSNEKDEEDEEEESGENVEKSSESGQFPPGFGAQQTMLPPGALDQSPMRMLRPPGVFPPRGPPGSPQPWSMRLGGPRHMRPMGMPPMGGEGPDMFNNMPPMMGPRGPMFMGRPGFPRMPMGRGMLGNMRAPVSLLDLDLKPPENFEGERFDPDDDMSDNNTDGNKKDTENKDENNEEGGEGWQSSYTHNSWKSSRDRGSGRDRSHRDDDRDRDRNGERHWDRSDSRGRDRDRDRDRERNWDRDDDRYRERDRDRRDSRDRDRDRNRGDREERSKDRDREDRSKDRDKEDRSRDRDRDRDYKRRDRREDRERTRPSRWSNADDTPVQNEDSKQEAVTVQPEVVTAPVESESDKTITLAEPEIETVQMEDENTQSVSISENNQRESECTDNDVSEKCEPTSSSDIAENSGKDEENPSVHENRNIEPPVIVNDMKEKPGNEEAEVERNENGEIHLNQVDNAQSEKIEESPPSSANGPLPDEISVPSSKLDTLRQEETSEQCLSKGDSNENGDRSENKENQENLELEEGEIAS